MYKSLVPDPLICGRMDRAPPPFGRLKILVTVPVAALLASKPPDKMYRARAAQAVSAEVKIVDIRV